MEGGYCGLAAPPSPCSQVVLRSLTGYKRPVGDRRGRWSLSVTRNWRMTFRVDEAEGEIVDLDFEDYH